MKVKLSSDDRCAIDLVLEERAAAGDGNLEHRFGKTTAALQKRIRAVEKVFDLMSQWPAQDPPTNLVAATMRFVQRHEHEAVPGPAAAARRPATVSHASAEHRSLH